MMKLAAFGLVAAVLTVSANGTTVVEGPMFGGSREELDAWMGRHGEPIAAHDSVERMRLKFARSVATWASDKLKDVPSIYSIMSWFGRGSGIDTRGLSEDLKRLGQSETLDAFVSKAKEAAKKHSTARSQGKNSEYPYWSFIPNLKGAAIPDGETVSWTNECCKKNTAKATWNEDKTDVLLTIDASECSLIHTGDVYFLGTVTGIHIMKLSREEASHKITWRINSEAANQYDLAQKGIRIMAFLHDEVQLVSDIMTTAELFLQPEAGKYPDYPKDKVMEKNVDFLTKYAKIPPYMKQRSTRNITGVNPDLIQSGDFIGVIRLDGLDPMLGWAMGSTTGHTTIALRDENNQLFVCESTTNSSYWPTNGIQKTPYNTWIQQAKDAGYNAVWAPLDPARRAKLNTTEMWRFFNETEGLQYGYHNMLWGWIDTLKDNYPCLPPDYATCLRWEHIEILFSVVNKMIPFLGDLMYNQAFNLRVGTTGLSPPEVFMYSETKLQIPAAQIPTMVEKDEWRYNTTRYGKPVVGRSMVCCVFVCHMWKAGGLFGDKEVNCGELTNLDDYDLGIFDKSKEGAGRPQVCKDLDPENQNCQLVGPYTLNFNHYNVAPIYDHMAEKCPTWTQNVGPNYWPEGKVQGTC